MNQPFVVFLLLVGAGGFLVVGELQTMARRNRRKVGESAATGRAASVGPPGVRRRYRLTALAAAGLLLVIAFGTTSASFSSQQVLSRMQVDVVFPTISPTATPTDTATPTSSATPTGSGAPTHTATPTQTVAPTEAAPTDTAASTEAPPTEAPPTEAPPTEPPPTEPPPTEPPPTEPPPTEAPTDTDAP